MPLMILLVVLWALNWPASQLALEGVPPLSFRIITLFGGGLALFVVCLSQRNQLKVPKKHWLTLILLSLLNVGFFNVLSAFALGVLQGGRAAIIAFTMPVWVAIIQVFLGVRLSVVRLAAIGIGAAGIFLIVGSIFSDPSFDGFAGALMAVAAISWAMGSILLSRSNIGIDAKAIAMWMTLISGVFTLTLIPFQAERIISFPENLPSLVGVVYATLIGMSACQAIWFFLLSRIEPIQASLLLLAIPPLGSLFSWLIMDAIVSAIDLVALCLLAISACLSTVLRDKALCNKSRLTQTNLK